MSEIPEGLWYNAEHDWLRIEGDTGVMGITDYAQGELGDIVFLELPEVGDHIDQDQSYGTIEAVKTVADLYTPISGEILEVNTELTEDASQVNIDPYGEGWMIKVKLSDSSEIEGLMNAEDYEKLLDESEE